MSGVRLKNGLRYRTLKPGMYACIVRAVKLTPARGGSMQLNFILTGRSPFEGREFGVRWTCWNGKGRRLIDKLYKRRESMLRRLYRRTR